MKHIRSSFLCLSFLAVAACGPGSNDDADAIPELPDRDGDFIADVHEGCAEALDFDGDGILNCDDLDSDADGIPDSVEAGDQLTGTPPSDADGDGDPDFLDLDADNNGILDANEGANDADSDGLPDSSDADNDGDGINDIVEIGPNPSSPIDFDNDGIPDLWDRDSDDDTILDLHERTDDPDMDGIPSYHDLDSEDDCIPDSLEAGDGDVNTPPVDTDGDGRPDFKDQDSDADGLPDAQEDLNCNGTLDGNESSAYNPDTDGDGTSDLIEVAAGTDPTDSADNPQADGDFVFVVPYQEPTTPPEDTLEFRTSIQFADIYFSFDTTGSMSAELSAMRNQSTGVPAIIDRLRCEPTGGTCTLDSECAAGNSICFNNVCVRDPLFGPGCIPDMYTGVGVWSEIDTFRNLVSLQSDPTVTAAAVPGTGGGSFEAPLQAPACVADDLHCLNSTQNCTGNGVGCVGYRPEAVRILIQITDADQQCSGSRCGLFSADFTGQQLQAKDIKFISLYGTDDAGGTGSPQSIASDIGIASNTVNSNGEPFVYPAIDAAVVDQTVQAVLDISRGLPLDVPIGAEDMPGDAGDALQFIDYLEVNVSGVGECSMVTPTEDRDGDNRDDAFPQLFPGTPVCWDVHPVATNTTAPATEEPQLFEARLTVYGDGSPLDSRRVFFLVPPVIFEPPIE